MTRALVGNNREIPGGLPHLEWDDRVKAVMAAPGVVEAVPWYDPQMEYLAPEELRRLRAKALVWFQVTGEWPQEVAWWWEVRLARRRGDIPHMAEIVAVRIDEDGVLHCGFCEARWSANHDGTPHQDRCKLCDRLWLVTEDKRDKGDNDGAGS